MLLKKAKLRWWQTVSSCANVEPWQGGSIQLPRTSNETDKFFVLVPECDIRPLWGDGHRRYRVWRSGNKHSSRAGCCGGPGAPLWCLAVCKGRTKSTLPGQYCWRGSTLYPTFRCVLARISIRKRQLVAVSCRLSCWHGRHLLHSSGPHPDRRSGVGGFLRGRIVALLRGRADHSCQGHWDALDRTGSAGSQRPDRLTPLEKR